MSTQTQRSFQMPPSGGWMQGLVIGLFVLYVVELVLLNVGLPLESLSLFSLGSADFAPWQLFTRFFVQGRGSAIGVLIGLVVLYLILPALPRFLSRNQWIEALLATTIVATLLPLAVNAAGLLPGIRTGWQFLLVPLFVVFGLAQPNGTINLYFVLPVPAKWIVWGTLIFSLVILLAAPGASSFESVSAWLGIYGWWHLRGPGRRRRQLLNEASKIEKELSRFTVLEGGRSGGAQSDSGNRDDDDWVH